MTDIVSEEAIRQTLLDEVSEGTHSKRELIRAELPSRAGGEETGAFVYSLSGDPPHGYAIFVPELQRLMYYSRDGEQITVTDGVAGVVEVDELMREVLDYIRDTDECTVAAIHEAIELSVVVHGSASGADVDADGVVDGVVTALKNRGVVIEEETDGEGVCVRLAI